MKIGLVACSKTKRDQPSLAGDLYRGTLFQRASAYAERVTDMWYILSAKHGLVHPGTVLEPYDVSLYDLSAEEQRQWGERVLDGILEFDYDARYLILAGKAYRENIVPFLKPDAVEIPLEGLGIGEQLAWLNDRLESLSTRCRICEVAVPTHPGGLCSGCKQYVTSHRQRQYGYPV